MGTVLPSAKNLVSGVGTAYSMTSPFSFVAHERLPTDPMFFANLTLENIAIGSRYLITRASDGLELAAGEAANTTVTLTGIAVYSNPMLVKIAVRKGTTAPKYIPLDAYASMSLGTATAYISQVPDPIA